MQIFMSFIKGNQSNKYVTALYCSFQAIQSKMAVQNYFFPFLMVQMFFPIQQGPNFIMIGKSLTWCYHDEMLHNVASNTLPGSGVFSKTLQKV